MDIFKTDPEYARIFQRFVRQAEKDTRRLDARRGYMVQLAALIGRGATDAFVRLVPEAVNNGLDPIRIKEIIYQASDYLGYGRILPFLGAVNSLLTDMGYSLPLEGQGTVDGRERLEKGARLQAQIFGRQMRTAWQAGTVNRWLAENCFGDFYTRKGLALEDRELITFCFLMAQGGCEPQLVSHAAGNMNIGNSEQLLTDTVLRCLPYIGYPRALNAISCIGKAAGR